MGYQEIGITGDQLGGCWLPQTERETTKSEPKKLESPVILLIWLCHAFCGILVPQPETEPGPLAAKAQSPNHWTTRGFLILAI